MSVPATLRVRGAGDGRSVAIAVQSLSAGETADTRPSDAVSDGKTGTAFGRERSPIELVLVEIL
jgi:hypothetical protein